jgi:hypothetical protein
VTLVRIVNPHTDLGEDDYHQWITLSGDRVKADRRGHFNSRMYCAYWTRWICNNGNCRGTALVSDDAVVSLIEQAELQESL